MIILPTTSRAAVRDIGIGQKDPGEQQVAVELPYGMEKGKPQPGKPEYPKVERCAAR
jgi:hypothetical protein